MEENHTPSEYKHILIILRGILQADNEVTAGAQFIKNSKSYLAGFIPYTSAAFLVGIVGGFSTVLGPAFVQDICIAYNNTTWTALAQTMSTAACVPIREHRECIGHHTAWLFKATEASSISLP